MREASAHTLEGVERRRTEAGTAHVTGGERNRAVLEAYEAAIGEGDPEDRRGKGGAGGVSVRIGLTVDVPGDGPALWVAMLQEAGVGHVFFEDGAGER
jgi:hypothetical protein